MRRFFVGLAITAMLGVIPGKARGDDRQISQAIVKCLQAEQKNNKLSGFNIDLEVDDGDVYLKGTVSSDEQEALAIEVARRVDGVRQVFNELEIKEKASESSRKTAQSEPRPAVKTASVLNSVKVAQVSAPRHIEAEVVEPAEVAEIDPNEQSRELAGQIISRLKQEKSAGRLQGFSIDVEVENGVAWLNGKVTTKEQQDRALEIVRRVPGIKQVVNGLSITQPTKTPTEVAQQIVASLREMKANGKIRDFSVDVEVDNGIVWLTGYTASTAQQQIILDAARYVPGVTKVVNDMTIGNPRQATQVAAQVASEPSRPAPVVPRPLPMPDTSVGSEIASRPAPIANRSGAPPKLQYMFVPANPAASPGASQTPLAFAPARAASHSESGGGSGGDPVPMNASVPGMGIAPARFDHPQLPQYAWPSYAPYPNYGAVTYPKQYSPMAWPYIGPFYPYPQVPLGWRKVELQWKDGWWQLDFKDRH